MTVRGKKSKINETILAKVAGLFTEGERWIDNHIGLENTTKLFINLGEELAHKGKGFHPASFREPWWELAEGV